MTVLTPDFNTTTTRATNATNNKEHSITSSMLPTLSTFNTSSFATNLEFSFDEQILSPSNSYCSERKTPFSVSTEDNNSFEENNLFYETDSMCDNGNSLIDFEDDMLKFSKHAEITEKDIIESYEAKKPMPSVMVHLASVQDEYYNKNELIVDDSLCVKTDLSSQVSANMVIYPTENEIEEKSEVIHDRNEHNYTTSIEQQEKVVVENIPTNNNNNNHSINHIKNNNNNQRRVPSLTLNIPKPAFQDVVSTPDITNDILEMEDKFDLINYITKNVSLYHHTEFC